MASNHIPPALAEIANGRDHIQTSELSRAISRAVITIRKRYNECGSYYGIRPVKFGNKLLWPVSDIAKLLNGGAQ